MENRIEFRVPEETDPFLDQEKNFAFLCFRVKCGSTKAQRIVWEKITRRHEVTKNPLS
jgi:hypothetical protein